MVTALTDLLVAAKRIVETAADSLHKGRCTKTSLRWRRRRDLARTSKKGTCGLVCLCPIVGTTPLDIAREIRIMEQNVPIHLAEKNMKELLEALHPGAAGNMIIASAIEVGERLCASICVDILLGKDRPPPALSGDNRELSRIREDHAKERHDRRPLHEPSKSRVAPPQATLVNSEETTKDYASTGGRKYIPLMQIPPTIDDA